MEALSNKEFDNSVIEEKEKICEDILTPLKPEKSKRHVKSIRQTDFALDRKKSLSFDWSEFEKVFAEDLSEFNNKAGFERLVSFLSEVTKIIAKYLKSERDVTSKVLDFHHPHQLREMMDHCLYVDDQPRDLEQLLSDCKETLKYCVKTAHPRFLNQLSTGIDIIGLAGEWVTAAANTNMFTYEIAPVFTLMEETVLQRMKQLIGWSDGDAIFAPGGAMSNLYAVLTARHLVCPDVKHDGMYAANKLAVFTSVQSHFSIKKAAVLLGIGLNNVYSIDTDSRGRMDVAKLEEAIQRAMAAGVRPLLVNATCGTTVLGAYDPVNAIADVCEKYGVWMHIDGAWGGSVLFTEKYRYLLDGVHRADSMTWNPHKMMGVPLQCSAIFIKKQGELESVNELGADYLYQKDKMYDTSYDTGDKAIQCGRHNDVFKLWLMWRSKGDGGFRDQIERNFEKARYLLDKLRRRDDFELVIDEIEGPTVCFWYIPEKIRAIKSNQDRCFHLHKLTATLKALMMEKGSMMLQYQPLGQLPNFFRIAFSNPAITTADLDFVVQELVDLAEQID
ncbi:glutamate decarboxylase 1-like [Dreissena polymorpha]|nr:glutamate decarboxylase 1-like [Dreissena polymorpha]